MTKRIVNPHPDDREKTEWLEFGCRGKNVKPLFKSAFDAFTEMFRFGNNADRLIHLSEHGLSIYGLYMPVNKLIPVGASTNIVSIGRPFVGPAIIRKDNFVEDMQTTISQIFPGDEGYELKQHCEQLGEPPSMFINRIVNEHLRAIETEREMVVRRERGEERA